MGDNTIRHHVNDGYDVLIKLDELIKIAEDSKYCPYCGCRMLYGPKNGRRGPYHTSPTLDRRNNERAMTSDNIDIICHDCDMAKQDRTREEFISYCRDIVEVDDENRRWVIGHPVDDNGDII